MITKAFEKIAHDRSSRSNFPVQLKTRASLSEFDLTTTRRSDITVQLANESKADMIRDVIRVFYGVAQPDN